MMNHTFGIYLLMEDSSSTIEWARSEGKGIEKLFILMLSSDLIRYIRQTVEQSNPPALETLFSPFLDNNLDSNTFDAMKAIIPEESISLISYLIKFHIPLHAAMQTICELVWDYLLAQLASSLGSSKIWISLRKNIVRTANRDLTALLNDRESRKCFEEYLDSAHTATDLTCLLSWRDTNKTLQVSGFSLFYI